MNQPEYAPTQRMMTTNAMRTGSHSPANGVRHVAQLTVDENPT